MRKDDHMPGRPALPEGQGRTARVDVCMTPAQADRLREIATARRMPLSKMCAKILIDWAEAQDD